MHGINIEYLGEMENLFYLGNKLKNISSHASAQHLFKQIKNQGKKFLIIKKYREEWANQWTMACPVSIGTKSIWPNI